jgi:hypothetical protein
MTLATADTEEVAVAWALKAVMTVPAELQDDVQDKLNVSGRTTLA